VRRITIRLRPLHSLRWPGGDDIGVTLWLKLKSIDLRLLGAIAVAMVTLIAMAIPNPAQDPAPSRVAQGERGNHIVSFAFSPTSAHIATTNDSGRVTLRASENGWQIERFLDIPGFATALAFSPDGRSLAVVGYGPEMYFWDLRSHANEPTQTIMVPIERPKCVAFSPDGQSIAVTSFLDGTILLLDLATRRKRMVLHQRSPVASIAFSPDGQWLATGAMVNRSIQLWNLRSGSSRSFEEGVTNGLTMALACSPDGALLASAGFPEHHVRLWDLKSGRLCRLLEGHSRPVTSIAFSVDGSLLATVSNDGTLGLWTVTTGVRRLGLNGDATWLQKVAFSPDGQTLALATGDDDDIRFWDLAELLRPQRGSRSTR
jgi:WD40 repeat protein